MVDISNVSEFVIRTPLWYQIHSLTNVFDESHDMESASPNTGEYRGSGGTEMMGGTTERERDIFTWYEDLLYF